MDLRGANYKSGQGFATFEECVASCEACIDGYGKPTYVVIKDISQGGFNLGFKVRIQAPDGTIIHEDASHGSNDNELTFENYCPEDLTICVSTDKRDWQGKAGIRSGSRNVDMAFRNRYGQHMSNVKYEIVVVDSLRNVMSTKTGGYSRIPFNVAGQYSDAGCIEKSCSIGVENQKRDDREVSASYSIDTGYKIKPRNTTGKDYVAKWKRFSGAGYADWEEYLDAHKAAGAIRGYGLAISREQANVPESQMTDDNMEDHTIRKSVLF